MKVRIHGSIRCPISWNIVHHYENGLDNKEHSVGDAEFVVKGSGFGLVCLCAWPCLLSSADCRRFACTAGIVTSFSEKQPHPCQEKLMRVPEVY